MCRASRAAAYQSAVTNTDQCHEQLFLSRIGLLRLPPRLSIPLPEQRLDGMARGRQPDIPPIKLPLPCDVP
jgi:hypothetical protein